MNKPLEPHDYWLRQIGSVDLVPLPFWPAAAGEAAEAIEVDLDPAVATLLHRLTNGAALLNHAAVIAATQVTLALQSEACVVAVGSPPRLQNGLAPPANLLPIIQRVSADLCFSELLVAVRQSLLDAFAIQDFSCSAFFKDFFARSSAVEMIAVSLAGFSGQLSETPAVTIEAVVDPVRVHFRIAPQRRFARSALLSFLHGVARVLAHGLRDHAKTLRNIDAAPGDRLARLAEWNATAGRVRAGSVISRFEREAARRPEALALAGEQPTTYHELNRRAAALARRLLKCGVAPEQRVALRLERPAAMVIAILATLKAGGAFVPLDPRYPTARIQRIIADARPRVIVTDDGTLDQIAAGDAAVLPVETPGDPEIPDLHDMASPVVHSDQLAYLIYTSGSTGEPRGVLVTHGSLSNAIHYFGDRDRIDRHSRVSQICSFGFDASVFEIFLALTRGAVLCIAPQEARASGGALGKFLREQAVDVIGAVTPAVLALVEPNDCSGVRAINIGADRCPADLADQWGPGRLLLNCYGPTEATIDCICAPCPGQVGAPPIGKPITNTRAYVLDGDMRPVAVGTIGQLYIGGSPVARGYHGQPGYTAERFVPDPFADQPGARLYRTGDLARWRADGTLDFCGRSDRQAKVDGLRIELGEIEAELARHPALKEVAVEIKPDETGQRRLIAYAVPNGSLPPARQLRDYLSRVLPVYMLPSAFVAVERFPLNANGKLDRNALPTSSRASDTAAPGDAQGEAVEPRGEIERALADIWKEILGVERIGRDDNFFDLGGRSLQVTRVMSKIVKACGVGLPLETMFNAPTIAGLAAAIVAEQAGGSDRSASLARVTARPSVLPLSFSQQRLWFLQQVLPPETAAVYNGAVPVRLHGPLDADVLAACFNEVIRRHEVLRTAFRVVDGEPAQIVLAELPFAIGRVDLRQMARVQQLVEAERIVEADARRPFDLEHPPLLRAQLIALADDEFVLLLNIHHIIFDGWSVGVLLSELSRLYAAFVHGDPSPLPALPLQYADFAIWQRRWLEEHRFAQQFDYWRRQLADLPDLLLPTNSERPKLPTYRGAIESFRLLERLTRDLKLLSREADVTLFMTLLAGLKTLFHRYTAQEDVVISSPVANRNRAEIEGLIGFFVNSLVLRTDLSGAPSFRELLARIRRVTIEAYDHQDVPFERLVEILRPNRMATHNPLFRAAFSLQNGPTPIVAPPGFTITPWPVHNRTAKFDFVLAMIDTDSGLVGDIEYSSELFEHDTICEMIELYRILLESVVRDPDQALMEIPLVAEQPIAAQRLRVPATERIRETFTF